MVKDVCQGCPDEEVLRLAREEKRVLLTADKDFGELVVRFQKKIPGVVRYHLPEMTIEQQGAHVANALRGISDCLQGWITTIEAKRVRRRPFVL